MKEDENFVAAWIESENSLQKEYLCETFNIDPNRFVYIEHDRINAGEKTLDIAESILATGTIDLFCINSLKCLVPSEEFEKSITKAVVGVQARMNGRMSRKFMSLIAEHETAFVIITHLSTDIGSMSRDPLIISGGSAIIYAAAVIMDLRKKYILETDPVLDKENTIKIGVKIKKNHCVPNKNPYVQTEYYAIFGKGIEQNISTIEHCIKAGILQQNGAFIREPDANGDPKIIKSTEEGVEDVKLMWQGKQKLLDYIENNPEYFDYLSSRVKTLSVEQIPDEEIEEIIKDEKAINSACKPEVKKNNKSKPIKSKNTKK